MDEQVEAVATDKDGAAKEGEEEEEAGEKEDTLAKTPRPKAGGWRGMAYERETHSMVNMRTGQVEMRTQRLADEDGERAVDSGAQSGGCESERLRQLLKARFGSCVRGWREALDVRGVHRVGKVDFFKAMQDLGFKGVSKAWTALMQDRSESFGVALADVDAESSQVLSEFYRAFTVNIGPLTRLVENSDASRISRANFKKICQVLSNAGGVKLDSVFDRLHTDGNITTADCAWLEHYCERRCKKCGDKHHAASQCPKQSLNPLDSKGVALSSSILTKQAENMRQCRVEQQSKQDAQDFRTLLRHRYGGITAAWRKLLDTSNTGAVTMAQLEAAAAKIGFKGDVSNVWHAVTGGHFTMRLADLDPGVLELLGSFRAACVNAFGSLVSAFHALNAEQKPLVTHEEFIKLCVEINMERNHKSLFEQLDVGLKGAVLLMDVDAPAATKVFGEKACVAAREQYEALQRTKDVAKSRERMSRRRNPKKKTESEEDEEEDEEEDDENPRELTPTPEEMRSEAQRKALLAFMTAKHGSPVCAWSMAIDRKGAGKVTRDEFLVGCATAGFQGNANDVWKGLGLNEESTMELATLLPEINDIIAQFKSTYVGELSDEKGFIVEDTTTNRKIEEHEFMSMVKKAGLQSKITAEEIFRALDFDGAGCVWSKHLRWLYDFKHEEKALSHVIFKNKDAKAKKLKKKLGAASMQPAKQILEVQDKKITQGRAKRGGVTEAAKVLQEFERHMVSKFGGLCRAWQLALDPERKGEIGLEDWTDGMRRAGYIKIKDVPERVELAQKLFAHYADNNTSMCSLANFDPPVDRLMLEFKRRCVIRYGSLEVVFFDLMCGTVEGTEEEIDPDCEHVISVDRFKALCYEIKMIHGVHRLLEFLDPDKENSIRLEEIDEETTVTAANMVRNQLVVEHEKAEAAEEGGRTHMLHIKDNSSILMPSGADWRRGQREQDAHKKVLDNFKAMLLRKHGTLVKAWRKIYGEKNKVSFEDFEFSFDAYASEGLKGNAADAWKAVELDEGSETLTIETFDPNVKKDVAELTRRILERFGSAEIAFEEMDPQANYELGKEGFLRLCYECQIRGNERRLLDYLGGGIEKVDLAKIDSKAVESLKALRKAGKVSIRKAPAASPPASPHSTRSGDDSLRGSSLGDVALTTEFRSLLTKYFGSTVRAWRSIDKHGASAITRNEFCEAVAITGFKKSPKALWNALVGSKARLTLAILDPAAFEMLSAFYLACRDKKSESLAKAFKNRTYSLSEFEAMCKAKGVEDVKDVFRHLSNAGGEVTWEQVRFLEEGWKWDGEPKAIRREPPLEWRPSGHLANTPARTFGDGPLSTGMRPQKVTLTKSTSLPVILAPIRAQWNDRHQIKDYPSNKTEQLNHLVAYVNTQGSEILRRDVQQQMLTTSVAEWFDARLRLSKDGE